MKQINIALCLSFLLATGLSAQAVLTLDKPEIDLGIVYGGSLKKGRLTLKNTGNDTLRIFSVQPGCGCTAIKKPKELLAPRESDDIEIEFNSIGYRGRVEKDLFISTSDPASQYVVVKIIADVREEMEPTTKTNLVWLGNVPVGGTVTQTVSFRNMSNRPLTIRGTGSSVATVLVKPNKTVVQPKDSVTVQITVKAMRTFYANERFWLELDSKNQPRVDMRVSFIGVAP